MTFQILDGSQWDFDIGANVYYAMSWDFIVPYVK
jgi:hypothetical protein